uniref:Uncharacterized protein n=1 Tax=Tanacetum cinerariifolium TaxID=118510 RepID=A0A699QDV3_TANCI|nr:hypothetical protein [Tanacetum cinerariifolium]
MVLSKSLEIRDYQLRLAAFEFSIENLQMGVKKEDSVTNVKNTVLDFSNHESFLFSPCKSKNSRRLDHEVHSAH